MYKRQNTLWFVIGWLLIALGALFMFTREERHEVWNLLMEAVGALEQRNRSFSIRVKEALKQESSYVAE